MNISEEQKGRPDLYSINDAKIRSFLMQAPAAIVVVTWPGFVVNFVNDRTLEMVGRKDGDLLGAPLKELFPEANWESMQAITEQVHITGKPFIAREFESGLKIEGVIQTRYFDFTASPVVASNGNINEIMFYAVDVTERVNERKRNEETEKHYQALVTNAPLAIAIIKGDDLIITLVNKVCLELLEKDESIIGQPVYTALPALMRQGLGDAMKKVIATGQIVKGYEVPVNIRSSGPPEIIYINYVFQPQYDINGKVEGVLTMTNEVTSQALLNNKLKNSEQQLQLLSNAMPQVMWMAEPNGVVTYCNDRVLQFAVKNKNEQGLWDWRDFTYADDLPKTAESWKHALSIEDIYETEHRFIMKNGTVRWHLSRAYPLKNEQGKIVRWYGTATDIHEQKTFSEKLEASVAERTRLLQHERDFAETVINSTNDVIAVFDTDMTYIICNTKMLQQYNRKKEDVIGKQLLSVFPDMKDSEFMYALQKCLAGETILLKSYKSLLVNRWFQNYFVPLKEDNIVYGAVVVGHDITELMEASEKIEQKNQELQQSNKEMESFTYVASHDLQEPLRKIQMFIQLLNKNKDDEEAREKYLDKINGATQRMSQLIQSILNYSKLSGPVEKTVPVDLNDIMAQVKSDFELLIEEKKAVVTSNKLPVIQGVPVLLTQLFSNLVSNSLKFTRQNPAITVNARIVKGTEIKGHDDIINGGADYAELKFTDNGIGFEPEFADKIFTLFQRLHGKSEYSGSGVGLSIVKKIAERHNGFVSAHSNLGEGATFVVVLPVN